MFSNESLDFQQYQTNLENRLIIQLFTFLKSMYNGLDPRAHSNYTN